MDGPACIGTFAQFLHSSSYVFIMTPCDILSRSVCFYHKSCPLVNVVQRVTFFLFLFKDGLCWFLEIFVAFTILAIGITFYSIFIYRLFTKNAKV